MRINELFQGQKQWRWEFRGSEEAIAEFTVGNVSYTFHAYTDPHAKGAWEIEFQMRGGNRSHNEKFGLTGTGNSAEVLGTVVSIMREFLHTYAEHGKPVTKLVFSAKEDSRQSLYAKMAQRLLPDWELSQLGRDFVLSAPKPRTTI